MLQTNPELSTTPQSNVTLRPAPTNLLRYVEPDQAETFESVRLNSPFVPSEKILKRQRKFERKQDRQIKWALTRMLGATAFDNFVDSYIPEDEKNYDFVAEPQETENPDPENLAIEELTEKDEKHARFIKRATALGKKAVATTMVALTAVTTATSAYMFDVANNMILADKAKPSVVKVYPALKNKDAHKVLVGYDGFNTFGAFYLEKKMKKSIQQAFGGAGLATQYNNDVLNAAEIGEEVDDAIDGIGLVTAADFLFHSAGDFPGTTYMVSKINDSDLPVETATYIAGPANYEGLTEKTQQEYATAEALSDIPYIEYSSFFRYLLEMYFYKDSLQKNPIQTVGSITTRFINGNVPSNLFLASQLKAVSNGDVPGKILDIHDDKFHTIFNVVRLKGDSVVAKQSADAICKAVEEIGHICNLFDVDEPNGGHGGYFTPEGEIAYDKLFKEIARVNEPQLKEEWGKYKELQFIKDMENGRGIGLEG